MSDERQITEILIDRDIRAFTASDWDAVADDFDADRFTGYSGADGTVRLAFATLDAYRRSWLAQAAELTASGDVGRLAAQLGAAQRIERIEVSGRQALAVKVFDGAVDMPGEPRTLRWTTYYFLRFDADRQRWLVTGFLGYLPTEGNAA